MGKHILVVVTNPTSPEQEKEYNDWYTNKHLDDVLKVPGFVAAQRFRLTQDSAKPLTGPYLAIYEMDCKDPKAAFEGLGKAADAGAMPMTSAIDTVNITASIYSPITSRKVAKAAKKKAAKKKAPAKGKKKAAKKKGAKKRR
jgi:hypothetical protein